MASSGNSGQRLPLSVKLAYGQANFGKSLLWSSAEVFLLFYFTDVLGIPPLIAGILLLVSLVWDGITDPIIGIWIDRRRSRGQGYRSYLLLGAPLTAFLFAAIFWPTNTYSTATVVYLAVTLLLFRTAYSFVDVPHNSMLASLTRDSRERSTLASLRLGFSSLGVILVSLGVFGALREDTAALEAGKIREYAALASAIFLISVFVCWKGVGKNPARSKMTNLSNPASISDFLTFFGGNRQLWLVFGIAATVGVCMPFFVKNIIYYAKYNLQAEQWAAAALLALTIGQIFGLPFWTMLSNHTSKATVGRLSHALLLLGLATFYVFAKTEYSFVASVALVGIALGGIHSTNWSLVPDTVEYGLANLGLRVEAAIFGFFTLTNKVGLGIGAGLIGLTQSTLNFQPNVDQPPATLDGILAMMVLMPAFAAVICLIALRYYVIDHQTHDELTRRSEQQLRRP